MLITFSRDEGRASARPRPIDELGHFGVIPDQLRLESGSLVLSYNRPGFQLAFSMDGSGKNWEAPICLLRDDPQAVSTNTDGYTTLMPIRQSEFPIGCTEFEHLGEPGHKRKAVLVRRRLRLDLTSASAGSRH